MSSTTKRKYVAQEFLEELVLPDADKKQSLVQIVGPKGNNLHEVEDADGEHYLVSMPPKFRKSIWIKRGDFVLVEPISEGDRVKGEIINIIRTKNQIAHMKSEGKWPARFEPAAGDTKETSPVPDVPHSDLDSDDESDLPELSPNLNRRGAPQQASSSSDSDESSSNSDDSEAYDTSETSQPALAPDRAI